MEDLFYRYNPWWEEKIELEGIVERPKFLEKMRGWLGNKQIVFLTGLRRVGKTTILKLFIKELIEKRNIEPRRIFYISLDDYNIAHKKISEIVEEYLKIQKLSFREKVYFFFDEVASRPDFDQELKNIYDNQNAKVYASSSSMSVFGAKKAYLTGRCFLMEILPLDFEEFLSFKGVSIKKGDAHLQKGYFEDFLKQGGMPEYILHGDLEYLKNLVDNVISKDIIAHHALKDPQLVKDYFLLLMERSGKQISINKVANILKISPDTAKRYLQMFIETYLVYVVPRWGGTNVRIMSPKKVYASDLGVRNLFTGFRDKGSLFENYVFLKIKSRDPFYVYEHGIELDFLTSDKILIETKYGKDLNNKQQELFKKYKAKKKILIKNIGDLQLLNEIAEDW